jgi:hypothetical protein
MEPRASHMPGKHYHLDISPAHLISHFGYETQLKLKNLPGHDSDVCFLYLILLSNGALPVSHGINSMGLFSIQPYC